MLFAAEYDSENRKQSARRLRGSDLEHEIDVLLVTKNPRIIVRRVLSARVAPENGAN